MKCGVRELQFGLFEVDVNGKDVMFFSFGRDTTKNVGLEPDRFEFILKRNTTYRLKTADVNIDFITE